MGCRPAVGGGSTHGWVAAGLVGAMCLLVTVLLPYWNPVGQVFLGTYVAAAGSYLTLAVYLTFVPVLSPWGRGASVLLLLLEFMALLISGYFAFEGCDRLCRVRNTRPQKRPDPAYMPKVSLQVPAFNEPSDMLIETIQSLERVDYPNLEILVVDNNTPDPTVTYLGGSGPVPGDAAFIVQTARWDTLKDHAGLLSIFADHLASQFPSLHLVLSGPSAQAVADDPEATSVIASCVDRYQRLDPSTRARVHLISCPMDDLDETDQIVNAMQRRAEIVFHKSLAEGFGLVVAEAMWKSRPVIASRVGGIQDQIEKGRSGVLIDGAAFGQAAHERVRAHFLMSRQLTETMHLLATLKLGK